MTYAELYEYPLRMEQRDFVEEKAIKKVYNENTCATVYLFSDGSELYFYRSGNGTIEVSL